MSNAWKRSFLETIFVNYIQRRILALKPGESTDSSEINKYIESASDICKEEGGLAQIFVVLPAIQCSHLTNTCLFCQNAGQIRQMEADFNPQTTLYLFDTALWLILPHLL